MPDLGILVLEVKGGPIQYKSNIMQWRRILPSGRGKKIRDPFKQAQRNAHILKDEIMRHSFPGEKKIPFTFGYAVIFPDCVFKGSLPPNVDKAIILSAEDLPFLNRRLNKILLQWCRDKNPQPLSRQNLNRIFKGLSPTFQILPLLFRRIKDQEEKLFRLTKEQVKLLGFIRNHKRAAIKGVAGSGKTLLAKAQAQRFADKGMKTLFVCYNRTLADWLEASMPEQYSDTITVTNFHRHTCREVCPTESISFSTRKRTLPPQGHFDKKTKPKNGKQELKGNFLS